MREALSHCSNRWPALGRVARACQLWLALARLAFVQLGDRGLGLDRLAARLERTSWIYFMALLARETGRLVRSQSAKPMATTMQKASRIHPRFLVGSSPATERRCRCLMPRSSFAFPSPSPS